MKTEKTGQYIPQKGEFFVVDETHICFYRELNNMYFKLSEGKYVEEIDGYSYCLENNLPYRYQVQENCGIMRPATDKEAKLLSDVVWICYSVNLMNTEII